MDSSDWRYQGHRRSIILITGFLLMRTRVTCPKFKVCLNFHLVLKAYLNLFKQTNSNYFVFFCYVWIRLITTACSFTFCSRNAKKKKNPNKQRENNALVLNSDACPMDSASSKSQRACIGFDSFHLQKYMCDVIKQNESELANTVFKIQANKANSFFCFLLLIQSFNCLYLWNQLPNRCGVFTKLKPKQYNNRKCQKTKISICWLQTHFAWSHHICSY